MRLLLVLCTELLLSQRKRERDDKRAKIGNTIDCDEIEQGGADVTTSHGTVKSREVVHVERPLKRCAVRVPVERVNGVGGGPGMSRPACSISLLAGPIVRRALEIVECHSMRLRGRKQFDKQYTKESIGMGGLLEQDRSIIDSQQSRMMCYAWTRMLGN